MNHNFFMTKLLSTAITLLFVLNLTAQSPEIEWQKTIGGNSDDYLFAMDNTNDGGYILAGYSNSNISGDKTKDTIGLDDYWLIKLNASGDIEWQKTFGGFAFDQLVSVQQTSDGGYILGGHSSSPISGNKTVGNEGFLDYWLVKLNAIGKIMWQKNIGSDKFDYIATVFQTEDGGYFAAGRSLGGISGDKTQPLQGDFDYWVVKLNASGDIQWDKTYGGNKEDYLSSAAQTSDGGYILGGSSKSTISGVKTEELVGVGDFWIIKIDAMGNIQWQNVIGSNTKDKLNTIQQTTDGGFIVGGYSKGSIYGDKTENSMTNDYWVLKLNSIGEIIWQNTIEGFYWDELNAIEPTMDGGYILGGASDSPAFADKSDENFGSFDYWIVKINSVGIIEWNKSFGGAEFDYLTALKLTDDGGFILAGYSNSDSSGNKVENSKGGYDYWVIKLAATAPFVCDPVSSDGHTIYLTPSKAKIIWSPVAEANDYTFQYRKSTIPGWTDVATEIAMANIAELEAGSVYKYRIRSNCGATSSGWNAINTFLTPTMPLKSALSSNSINLRLFPNPADTKLNIEWNFPDVIICTVRIVHVNGKVMDAFDTLDNTIALNISHYAAGIYIVEILFDSGLSYRDKIIIE